MGLWNRFFLLFLLICPNGAFQQTLPKNLSSSARDQGFQDLTALRAVLLLSAAFLTLPIKKKKSSVTTAMLLDLVISPATKKPV